MSHQPACRIAAYMHCGKCLEQLPADQSPAGYADLSVGWTEQGLQVWCNRHNVNVLHVDFEGVKHPGDVGIYGDFK